MPEEVKRKRGRPPKQKSEPVAEINSTTPSENTNEFCAWNNTLPFSSSYFSIGMTIFDLYKPEQISNLVKDPIGNNELLREISRILYGCNGTVTNTIDYMTAMPTLDKVLVPYGKSKQKKQVNMDLVTSTLRTIKDKEFVRDALYKGMVDGIAFYYFETTNRPTIPKTYNDIDIDNIVEINDFGINASIISLPTDYCRIVGIKNNSYVVAFNLDYFTDCNGETQEKKLRKFPKEIRDAFHEKQNSQSSNNWVSLDNTHTIVHKIRSAKNEKWGRPLVLAAIKDILYSDYFTDTKRNVLDEINNRIIYQTFPEKEKGVCALTQKQQESQHNAVKGAVMNKNNRGGISFFSVAAGTKLDTLDPANTDIFDSKNEENLNDTIALGLGIAGGLLNGSGSGNYSSQQNNIELLSAQIFQWIESIQSELNKCINLNIIKDSKNYVEVYYLPITYVNRKEMVTNMKDLYLQGKGSLRAWIASTGMNPSAYVELMLDEINQGYDEIFKPHETSFTISKNDNKGGRPESTDSTNPSTVSTKANGGNKQKKPSTK